MSITKKLFGKMPNGQEVYCYTLSCECGISAEIIDYGATLRSLFVPNKNGTVTDVVLGYDTLNEYITNSGYLGAVIGRNSNRVKGSNFQIYGKKITLNINDNGCNNLHGGIYGFNAKRYYNKN